MAICYLDNVSKIYYGGETVRPIENVELEIKEGDFLSIEGPSGSGKSTLLYLLGGLLKPTTGNVFIEGTNTSSLRDKGLTHLRSQNIGFIFQEGGLFPALTALENVELVQKIKGGALTPEERREKASQVLADFGLEDRLHFMPHELSVGQRRRVLVARGLINENPLILADEPTNDLDPYWAGRVINILEDASKGGQAVVMVTHHLEWAKRANRRYRLHDGGLLPC